MTDIDRETIDKIHHVIEMKANSAANKVRMTQASATVSNIQNGQIYVHVDGNESYIDTPVQNNSASVRVGDRVSVIVHDGMAFIAGNFTAPATDDTRANEAYTQANEASNIAEDAKQDAAKAKEAAEDAQAQAEAVDKKADEAKADIGTLGDRLDGVLTVDATYSETSGDAGSYTFTGYVFRAGVDVTDELMASDASKFSWTRKTEDGEVQIASGTRSVTVAKDSLGYGGSVTFYYDAAQDSALSTTASTALQSTDSLQLMAAASANSAGGVTLNAVYPVGSIYMSVNSTDPGTLFGGTWERLKDRFLLAAGDAYSAGRTGGEATHQLTADELPDHRHTFTTNSAGAHTYNTGNKRADTYGTGKADAMHYSGTFDVTSSSAGAHTHSGTTNGAGGSQPHNNMPPYLAVYVWKRTA